MVAVVFVKAKEIAVQVRVCTELATFKEKSRQEFSYLGVELKAF